MLVFENVRFISPANANLQLFFVLQSLRISEISTGPELGKVMGKT